MTHAQADAKALEQALNAELLKSAPDEADLVDSKSHHAGAKTRLKAILSKETKVSLVVELSKESNERFYDRIWRITDDLLGKAHAITFNTDFSKSIYTFQAWATFSRFDRGSVERNMFSAIENATKECLGKEHVTLLDLQSLSKLTLKDEGVRGVYLCIGYGPDGEIAIYIGSTFDLVERIAKHEKCIEVCDATMDAYSTLGQPGWTHEWKVLARFPENTHQCCSYML